MRKFLVFFFTFFLGTFLFILAIKSLGWEEITSNFLSISTKEAVVILILSLAIIGSATFRWQVILKDQGYPISFFYLFKLYCFDHSINFLFPIFPFGGEVSRAYFLKEKKGLPLKISASSTIIDGIFEITAHILLALLGIIYFVFKAGFLPAQFNFFLFSGLFFAILFLALFYFKSFKKESFLKIFLKNFEKNGILEIEKEVLDFFHFKKKKFWKGLSLAFLRDGISFLRTFFLLFFLERSFNFFFALSVFSFSIIIQLFPIPAFLGSHEIIQIFVFNKLGMKITIAPAFTLFIRVVDLFLALLGIFLIFNFSLKLIRKIFLDNKKFDKF